MELEAKVELAFVRVLRELLETTDYPTLAVHRGIEAEEMPVPRATCHCFNFSEEPEQSGNGFCDVSIAVHGASERHEDFDDPTGEHAARVAAVEQIWRDNLATLLTAAVDDFHVAEEMEGLGGGNRVEGKRFIAERRVRIYASGIDWTDTGGTFGPE